MNLKIFFLYLFVSSISFETLSLKHELLKLQIKFSRSIANLQYSFMIVTLFTIILTSQAFVSVYALPDHVPDIAKIKAGPFTQTVIKTENLQAVVQPLYTVPGNPFDYETSVGDNFDGTAMLILHRSDFSVGCTGGLLWSGEHILTAAHCLTDDLGNNIFLSGSATFEGVNGIEAIDIDVSSTKIHNKWNGDVLKGNDIAVLKLVSSPSPDIPRHQIDRDASDDVGVIVDRAGYGISGTGTNGENEIQYPYGVKRNGNNMYDDVADTMLKTLGLKARAHFVPGSVLQYDFDSGTTNNDAFGFFFGNSDLGLGATEVNSARGDSGGPTLYNGEIIGITSYGITLTMNDGTTTDVNSILDSSYGEFSGDTRVSQYVNFIDTSVDDGYTEPKCTKGMQKRGLC